MAESVLMYELAVFLGFLCILFGVFTIAMIKHMFS